MSIVDRYACDQIAHPPGVGLDRFYITDAKQRVGLKPGIIAKTHSEKNAELIIAALNYHDRHMVHPHMEGEVWNPKQEDKSND